MYPAGNLFIAAAHGRLEAIIKEPHADEFARPRGAALVLHPHPLHGGTMHNKVVFRAARALNDAGLVALRINFRGVGLSTGTHDRARGEQDDARTALDYLGEHYAGLPITLAGFSFGARVGLEVGINEERVARLVALGTPLKMYDFSFLRECRKPLLFVHGERDEFGDAREVERLASELPPEAEARAVIIQGAGHFFEQRLDEMQRAIREWAAE
ncbi:MAG TPA: alpha/beta fold hydrolase [Pyrinomonadaceae bacterium]|nr:alpha/beta fold hydrolase [Pyrinomonadaceae bacterium]